MLWKVKNQTIEPIQNTKLSERQFQERDLEAWIERSAKLPHRSGTGGNRR